MSLIFHVHSRREPTGPLVINCPGCKGENLTASTYTLVQETRLFWVIPLTRSRSYWMTCPNCGGALITSFPASELRGLPPDKISAFIRYRVSPVRKLLAILGLALFFFPFIGLALSLPAYMGTRKDRGWTRRCSLIAVILGSIVNLLFGTLLLWDKLRPSH